MHQIIITIPTMPVLKDRMKNHITQNRGRYALGLGIVVVSSAYILKAKRTVTASK